MTASVQNREAFAAWLMDNEPRIFAAIAERANAPLSGWGDIFSAIGGGLKTFGGAAGGAVKAVGGMLANPETLKSVSSIAGMVVQSKAQKNVLDYQLAELKANRAPDRSARVTLDKYGRRIAVAKRDGKDSLLSSVFSGATVPLMVGAGLLGVYLLTRKRARG